MNKTEEINKANEALKNVLVKLDETDKNLVITAHERDNNLRDVMMHLVKWQERLLVVLENPEANFLPDGYSWDNYQALNQKFFDEAQTVKFDEAVEQFKANNEKIVTLFADLTDENAAKLADNFALITYKHYPWAIDMIEKSNP